MAQNWGNKNSSSSFPRALICRRARDSFYFKTWHFNFTKTTYCGSVFTKVMRPHCHSFYLTLTTLHPQLCLTLTKRPVKRLLEEWETLHPETLVLCFKPSLNLQTICTWTHVWGTLWSLTKCQQAQLSLREINPPIRWHTLTKGGGRQHWKGNRVTVDLHLRCKGNTS